MSLTPRLALLLALAVTGATALGASAAPAPKTSTTSATFFLRQEGCGATSEAGRLDPKRGGDSATGCGTIGGLPFAEIAGAPEPFSTVGKGLPITLDASKKITGQLAAGSWYGAGAGGAGQVAFDVALTGTTVSGMAIDFGSATVTGTASPGQDVVLVPFTLSVPAGAAGARVKSLTLSLLQRGANVGMSAQQLDGDSYVVLPTKPAVAARKK